jgi:hypothetical protein
MTREQAWNVGGWSDTVQQVRIAALSVRVTTDKVELQTVKLARSMKCAILVSCCPWLCHAETDSLYSCPAPGRHCNERLDEKRTQTARRHPTCSISIDCGNSIQSNQCPARTYTRLPLASLAAAVRTLSSQYSLSNMPNSQKLVANALTNCGSSISGRYTPSAVRSSVERNASSLASLEISCLTKSIDLRAVAVGRCIEHSSKRLAKAAALHGGELDVCECREKKMRCRHRNSRSAVVASWTEVFFGRPSALTAATNGCIVLP